jgi:hypothetical protein
MVDMAGIGSARAPRLGARGPLATLLAALFVTVMIATLGACTNEQSGPTDADNPDDAALRVTSVQLSDLDETSRARVESEVSDVLAHYVTAGFLGDYPRGDFVQSFADFTTEAAKQAVGDIDVLTAARFAEASSVRATDLAAKLSFYVVDGEPVGATAWIDFAFDVDDHGTAKKAALEGRLVLDRRDGRWSVFAYQVHRDDSDLLSTEASSP